MAVNKIHKITKMAETWGFWLLIILLANQIVQFYNIEYLQNAKIVQFHFLYGGLASRLEPSE